MAIRITNPGRPPSAPRPSVDASAVAPRLGMVMRFAPRAEGTGVRQLESVGFRVASSTDFAAAAAVPNDFGGADVQYFERFGIAIVRQDSQRLAPTLMKAMEQKVVGSARAERTYRALGAASARVDDGDHRQTGSHDPDEGYLHGYRDGVNQLIDRLLADKVVEGVQIAARFDEKSVAWGLEAIGIQRAGIKVAVLDTGFDDKHPDFRGRTIVRKLFASRSSPDDVHGRGTHCIGTACGPMPPTTGPRYGVAYAAEIYAGKVLGDDGFGTDRSIIAGMDWALEQGCQIISMSLGAATSVGDQPNDDYEQIGQVCLDGGSLVVAAAGNESERPTRIAPVGSPANASTIMAVAAVGRNFRPASFSCGGAQSGTGRRHRGAGRRNPFIPARRLV